MIKFKIASFALKCIVKFTLLFTGGRIVIRDGAKYLVWVDSGFMYTPPYQHEIELPNWMDFN